jgi:hypothetical protein
MTKARVGAAGRYHFTYRIQDLLTGEWYGGKHSTARLNDGPRGSGD